MHQNFPYTYLGIKKKQNYFELKILIIFITLKFCFYQDTEPKSNYIVTKDLLGR